MEQEQMVDPVLVQLQLTHVVIPLEGELHIFNL